ncbi:MAG TPA: alpha/beta hydrolase [Cytophagaceae bacterium]|jgi:pimeloyl-ACP methyl ester carboxylesterase
MKLLIKLFLVIGLLSIIFLIGPGPGKISINPNPISTNNNNSSPEQLICDREKYFKIKPNNEARIIWADSTKKEKTEYSLVYIHGFSASQGEGDPIHKDFAKRYGMNLFLSRLEQHGLVTEEPFLNLKAQRLVASAKEAIAMGKVLGHKVILMSTSTGGTLSLYLAQKDPDIAALILYSPNIDLFDPRSFLLIQPWGLYISRGVLQSKYFTFQGDSAIKNYWYTKYRVEGLIELKNLIRHTMSKETFNNISQSTFVGYYFKNEKEQDEIVSVGKILEMYDQLATSKERKRIVRFSDVGHHALASKYFSKDIPSVEKATFRYAEEVLKLVPVE